MDVLERRPQRNSKGWSLSALETVWESWGCSCGEEKAPEVLRATSSAQRAPRRAGEGFGQGPGVPGCRGMTLN